MKALLIVALMLPAVTTAQGIDAERLFADRAEEVFVTVRDAERLDIRTPVIFTRFRNAEGGRHHRAVDASGPEAVGRAILSLSGMTT